MANKKRGKKATKRTQGKRPHGPYDDNSHGHKPHDPPYFVPGDQGSHDHGHAPPDNPRYPDSRIYGDYASKNPPPYVPHPLEHTCFKPRKEDYKPPTTCDDHDDDHDHGHELCVRKDHRRLTTDEQNRFLNAFSQINATNALGPMVDIHANAIHQMHSTQRFLPWHRIYLLRMEELLMMVDPTVCIPYWKSSEEQAFPSWLLGFTPTVNLLGGPHTVTRNIGAFSLLPNAAAVTAVMTNGTFNTFTPALQGVHNSGHVWWADPWEAFRRRRPTRCSGCITPRSIASGPHGRRPIPARIPPSPAPRRSWIHGPRPRSTRETSRRTAV